MNIEKDDIENLLLMTPGNSEVILKLSLQELARLSEIVFQALLDLEQKGVELSSNFESWNQTAKSEIVNSIKDSSEYFGDSKLYQKLDVEAFLAQFYHFESGDFLDNK